MKRPLSRLMLLASALALAACDNLETLERDQCGNTVIEDGEDCDGAGLGDNACNEACRLSCTAEGACPAGWGCGADGLCRQPSSLFEALGNTLPFSAEHLSLADVDGDGRSDVVATRGGSVTIAFADPAGLSPGPTNITFSTIDSDPDIPATGDLDGDGRVDLALRFGRSLGVLRGQQDRTLSPQVFSRRLAVPLADADHLVGAELDGRPEAPGTELLAYTESGLSVVHTSDDETFPDKPLLTWTKGAPTPAGQYGGALIHVFGEDGEIRFYQASLQGLDTYEWNHGAGLAPETVLSLPTGVTAHPVVSFANTPWRDVATMTQNSTFAVLVSGEKAGKKELYATYQVAGGFGSSPVLAMPDLAFGTLALTGPAGVTEPPFAIFDLDGDQLPDIAGPRGFFTSECVPVVQGSSQCTLDFDSTAPSVGATLDLALAKGPDAGDAWTGFQYIGASLFDVDFEGYPDMLVTTEKPGFILYRNLGSPYVKTFRVPTQSPVKNVAVGDFDGDGSRDIAFSQVSPRSQPGGPVLESVNISFGDGLGLPTPPVDLGDVGEVSQIFAATLFPSPSGKSAPVAEGDGVTDLVVRAATDGKTSTFVFAGSTDGQIQSPLDLASSCEGDSAPSGVPRYLALAALSGEGARDLAAIYRREGPGGEVLGYDLWAIRPGSSDTEAMCDSLVGPAELPDPGGTALSVIPADLDADGTDEVLVLARGSSKLLLAKLTLGSWSVETIDLGAPRLGITAAPVFSTSPAGSAPRDVIVWSEGGVLVLRNEGTGSLDPARAAKVSVEGLSCSPGGGGETGPVTGVAAVHLRPDEGRELVIVTARDVLVAEMASPESGTFGAAACPPLFPGVGGTAATSGDVDGDGVEDLVIARPGGVQVLAGIPVVR